MDTDSQVNLLSKFQMAVMNNRIQEVEELVAKGLDINCQFSSGWTALMYASQRAHLQVVAHLLNHGADPNSNKERYTALMAACTSTCCDEERVLACVCQLLDHGADVNAYDRYHMSPLTYAAREGKAVVAKKLIERNACINSQDSKGNSPLMWAAQRGHLPVVQMLVDASADVNLQKANGHTALNLATVDGHSQITEILKDLTDPKLKPADEVIKSEYSRVKDLVTETTTIQTSPPKSNPAVPAPKICHSKEAPSVEAQRHDVFRSSVTSSSAGDSDEPISNCSKRASDDAPVKRNDRVQCKTSSEALGGKAFATTVSACGDLELFLLGLDLRDLIPRFHSHRVTFEAFLQMTDSDLCQLGISSVDIRKRILNAIGDTHRKRTRPLLTTPPTPYNTTISCSESILMLSNIKRHLGFIGSSVGYISDRVNEDKRIVLDAPDPIHIREFSSRTEDALATVEGLYQDLVRFRLQLQELCPTRGFVPEDVASFKKTSQKPKVNWKRVLLLSGGAVTCIGAVAWLVRF